MKLLHVFQTWRNRTRLEAGASFVHHNYQKNFKNERTDGARWGWYDKFSVEITENYILWWIWLIENICIKIQIEEFFWK